MEFFEVIASRRSVRTFRPEPVPEKLLIQCLEAAQTAPS
jgi:nitroreductase